MFYLYMINFIKASNPFTFNKVKTNIFQMGMVDFGLAAILIGPQFSYQISGILRRINRQRFGDDEKTFSEFCYS